MKKTASLFLVFSLTCYHSIGQVITSGQWEAALYPGKIIKLSWSHSGQRHNEQISNAVIIQPTAAGRKISTGKPLSWPGQQVSVLQSGNSIEINLPEARLILKEAFDSLHIRGLRLTMPGNAPWLGGGERATPLIRNGQRISLYNGPAYGYGEGQDQLNYSVPFVLTTAGYGLFFDNPSRGYIDFGKTTPGTLEAAFSSGKLDVYIIPGSTPSEVIKNYSLLTGRQPLPPRWALGNFVSRFGYLSQQQAEDVVNRMQKDGFPMDAIILDLFWFGKTIQYTLGNLDWDKDNWPEPEKMIAGFKRNNINTILITEPFVIEGTKEYGASKPYLATDSAGKPFRLEEFYFGKGGIIDLFRKDARDWFWTFYKKQHKIGVSGWWGDLGEPENHPAGVMHNLEDLGIKRKMKADEVHNIYGHYWSQLVYENWKKDFPQKRLFFLNRAGYAGSQRFSIFPWTGDVGRNWSGFRAQLPTLQSMSLSGIPFAHSDAGGFAMTDKADPELYTRWLQFAAFTPVFRPHGSALEKLTPEGTISLASEPTFWDESTKTIARNLIMERYRLLPYHYTMAWEQTTAGSPLIRPMVLENTADTNMVHATDQYMWGSALLVAPVMQPGATTKKVYLPAGSWYDYRTNAQMPGNGWITVNVTIQNIPVFAKGGSFIPYWNKAKFGSTAEYNASVPLTLKYYPGISNQIWFVYDDDGQTPGSEKNAAAHSLMKWTSKKTTNGLMIAGTFSGTLTGKARQVTLQIPVESLNVFLGVGQATDIRISVNGKMQKMRAEMISGGLLNIPLTVKGTKMEVKIEKAG